MAKPKLNRFRSDARRPKSSRPPGRPSRSAKSGRLPFAAEVTEADIARSTQADAARRRGFDLAGGAPWWALFSLGGGAYREQAFSSTSAPRQPADDWGYPERRRIRYDVFWSHFEGNVFRAIHRWAETLKEDRGLYEYIRTIYSPAYRIIEFWAGHIWGGSLDPECGDGVAKPSCLPIITGETDRPELRAAIATLLDVSLWQQKKDTVTRFGAAKGDVAILVHDDAAAQSVSLRVIDPWQIYEVRRDSRGNVKEYVLQEVRPDPNTEYLGPFGRRHCVYTEWCRKEGSSVVTTTYLDGVEYDWREYPDGTPEEDEIGPTWSEPYDFVPMVFIQHRDMGLGFGWSELQPDFGKMYEVDDLASKLSDQIRKIVTCPLYIAGAAPGQVTVDLADDEGADRETTATLYGPPNSKPEYLVAQLDIKQASDHIQTILEDIEKDHPELQAENVGLAASGEARRVAREKTEAMVVQRRAPYDDALVRIVQMAISIAANPEKRYPGYEAFDEGSYDRGDLDFSIGDRPVFAVDMGERLAESQAKATTAKTWVDGGFPAEFALQQCGSSDQEVKDALKMIEEAQAKADARMAAQQEALMAANEGAGGPDDAGSADSALGGPGGPAGANGKPKSSSGDDAGKSKADIADDDAVGVDN